MLRRAWWGQMCFEKLEPRPWAREGPLWTDAVLADHSVFAGLRVSSCKLGGKGSSQGSRQTEESPWLI